MNEKEYNELKAKLIKLLGTIKPDLIEKEKELPLIKVYMVRGLKVYLFGGEVKVLDTWSDYEEVKAPIVLEAIIKHLTNA